MVIIGKISKLLIPFVAILLMASSMSYTIDFHYCQGQLKSFSLLGKAKNCHEMESSIASCHRHKKQNDKKSLGCSEGDKNCCSNKTVNFENMYVCM